MIFVRPTLALFVALAGSSAGAATLEAHPSNLVIGRDAQVQLLLKGVSETPEKIRLSCSGGELHPLHAQGTDLVADWSFNKTSELSDVLCAAVTPQGIYAFTVIGVSRREALSLTGLPPLSRVEVDVAGEHAGPVRSDGEGRAELQILRKAHAAFADITATPPNGQPQKSRRTFELLPPGALLFAPSGAVSADGAQVLPVHAFALDAEGAPSNEPSLTVSTPDGPQSLRRALPGVFLGSWIPAPRATDEEATLSLKGRGAKTRMRLLAGISAHASIHVREPVLAADGLATTLIVVRVTDGTGRPLAGQPVKLSVDRGQIGNVTDRTDGTYVAPYTAPQGSPGVVHLRAELGQGSLTDATLQLVQGTGLSVEPLDPQLPADGQSQTILRISARTDKGLPMANGTPVSLSATLGDVPDTTVLQDGRADVLYRAATHAGAAVITVRVGKLTQTTAVHLLPGVPSRVEVRADPQAINCQEQATLEVTVKDRFGNDVPHANVQLAAARGTVTSLDSSSNTFLARLSPDCVASAEDEAPVQVDAAVGEVKTSTTVAVQRRKNLALTAALLSQSDLGTRMAYGARTELSVALVDRVALGGELSFALGTAFGAPWSSYSLYLGPTVAIARGNRWNVALGAGANGHIVSGVMDDGRQVKGGTAFGAHARVLGALSMGPGDVVAQLRGTMPIALDLHDPAVAGIEFSAGYRFAF